MTPTKTETLPNEVELLEIEQDLDTEDFYIDDLYEIEDRDILEEINFEKSMTEIYMEEILGSDSWQSGTEGVYYAPPNHYNNNVNTIQLNFLSWHRKTSFKPHAMYL